MPDPENGGYPEQTQSLCPACLARIPAERVRRGGDVFLVKRCPEHGEFETPVWRGTPDFDAWMRPKTPSHPKAPAAPLRDGCPFDCGLCPDHGQHTCTLLVEVTGRCNLHCPVCFASSGERPAADPSLADVRTLLHDQIALGGPCNLQLSGGEPTVREDLPEIVALAKAAGFPFVQLNTNGLRLAETPGYAAALAQAGLDSVFLQCDGVSDAAYLALRGRALARTKLAAIENAGKARLGTVLTATVRPGVNHGELGDLIRLAVSRSPAVRGVHFQPMSHFGRYPGSSDQATAPPHASRITLPEIIRLLHEQTDGAVSPAHFNPPGCEHALCSFSGKYLVMPDASLKPLSSAGRCSCAPGGMPGGMPDRTSGGTFGGDAERDSPPSAAEGAARAKALTARDWAAPQRQAPSPAPPAVPDRPRDDLDRFLERAQTHILTVSAMAFMDAWTLDLDRLKGCCIHVAGPDGRRVPFCAYNLTAADGTPLYRGRGFPGKPKDGAA